MSAQSELEGERLVRNSQIEWFQGEVERLRAAALAFLLEQTDENAKALADVLGWKPKTP